MLSVLIRREVPADLEPIDEVHRRAFTGAVAYAAPFDAL